MATILKAGNVASGAQITSDATGILEIRTGTGAGTTAMTVDTSQNVGVGVTPSAWGSGRKAIQINGSVGYLALSNTTAGGYTYWNMYNDGTNNIAITTGSIAAYGVNPSGQHVWFNGTGTASTNASGLTQAMTLDASGNLGVGASSPAAKLEIRQSADGYDKGLLLTRVGANYGTIFLNASDDTLNFGRATSTSMTINASGNLLVGATSFSQGNFLNGSAYFNNNVFVGNTSGTASRTVRLDAFSDEIYVAWANNNTDNNSIKYAYGGTAWVNTSDETLKDIIEPITNAVEKVSSLRAVIGKYKTEDEGARHPFLIAQDVQQVLPEAVYLSKSRTEGEPDTLGVGYTDVIPLLVAAIKELNVKVEAQAAEIAALKGA
jgi:hypothetical protein